MAHARTQIRAAVVSAITGLATTGTNVFVSRSTNWPDNLLPGLDVSNVNEAVQVDLTDVQLRQLRLNIQAVEKVAPAVDADAAIDAICLEVENAIFADAPLDALVIDLMLESTSVQISGEGDQAVIIASMVWALLYQVSRDDPETILTS